MACQVTKFTGRSVVLEFAIGCADELPQENDWRRFGSLRTKEFSITWDTADATDADSVGALRENLATFQTMTISGDGTVKAGGAGAQNLIDLAKHVIRPDATGGQPVAWLRMTFPDLTFIAYMLISSLNRSAPYDDVVTYSFEATATASDFGLIIEDTPDPNAPDPATISVLPATMALVVGDTEQATAAVTPAGAPQAVRWKSSDVNVATVNQLTGLVEAVGVGTASVIAYSPVKPSVESTPIAVTVTPQVQSIDVTPADVSIEVADTEQLIVDVLPAGADQTVAFESDSPSVATVDNTGLVTGVSAGSAIITITSASNPAVSVGVGVEVTEP